MKIRPLDNYQLLGTSIVLDSNKVYDAEIATNIPNCKEKGLVFCDGILLDNTEYEVVE